MADRPPERDPAVDELRRKARRRLVGAVVLALAAAVLVPMLLEKEPRPLGEDVAVRIPPLDEGKFVNRLNAPAEAARAPAAPGTTASGGTEPASPKPPAAANAAAAVSVGEAAEPKASAAVDAQPTIADAEQRVLQPRAGKAEGGASAQATERAEARPSPPAAAPPPASRAAQAEPRRVRAAQDGFVVQLAAFADDKGANALASKLRRNGYAAYTEPVTSGGRTLYRVRVGGYASRDAAGDARNRLKGEGYSGIVAPAR